MKLSEIPFILIVVIACSVYLFYRLFKSSLKDNQKIDKTQILYLRREQMSVAPILPAI